VIVSHRIETHGASVFPCALRAVISVSLASQPRRRRAGKSSLLRYTARASGIHSMNLLLFIAAYLRRADNHGFIITPQTVRAAFATFCLANRPSIYEKTTS
jgi:hypothetical protein